MYKVKISKKQETNTNKAKSVLPSTELKAASSVKRPSNRDSPFKNSVLSNTKKLLEKVEVVQIVLWIVDNGCLKHMTGDRSLLKNFIEKFMGTVRFGNDHFAAITGYGDYVQGNIIVCYAYYVKGLGHNSSVKDNSVMGKSKKYSHQPKLVSSTHSKLELLYMDLCGPMRVATINGKKYILVIIDDYSRFTRVYFLHIKDETPEIIKKFIAQVQLNYNAKVHKIRTDNDTGFKNGTLKAHYEKLGIMQEFSIARTPQQNGVVERRNRTLIEVARKILIFSRLP
ncbi:putative ribonuclease H-like domain-containing protein [Tanacetum coccineum]